MQVTINNQTKSIKEGATLYDVVLDHLGQKQNGVAIAVNKTIIQKNEWPNTELKLNDDILIIKATQGG